MVDISSTTWSILKMGIIESHDYGKKYSFLVFKKYMNKWNIPEWLEREVINRDSYCVYCGVDFGSGNEDYKSKPTWEHIVNDVRIVTIENIVRCCFSCNASKGAKELSEWLESEYCKAKGITVENVSEVLRLTLENLPQLKL